MMPTPGPWALYAHPTLCIFTPTPPPASSPSAIGHPVFSCVVTSSPRPVHQVGLLSNLQSHFVLFMTHAIQTDAAALPGHTQSIPKMSAEGQSSGSNQCAQPNALAGATVTLKVRPQLRYPSLSYTLAQPPLGPGALFSEKRV